MDHTEVSEQLGMPSAMDADTQAYHMLRERGYEWMRQLGWAKVYLPEDDPRLVALRGRLRSVTKTFVLAPAILAPVGIWHFSVTDSPAFLIAVIVPLGIAASMNARVRGMAEAHRKRKAENAG